MNREEAILSQLDMDAENLTRRGHARPGLLDELRKAGLDALAPYADLPRVRAYAGIGSRKTPRDVLEFMRTVAAAMARAGYVLYSGGARGADSAFAQGAEAVGGDYRIFLPQTCFQGHTADGARFFFDPDSEGWRRAGEVARAVWDLHAARHGLPSWRRLSPTSRRFHTRNVLQVLGPGCDHRVACLVCYAPDGLRSWQERAPASGGTGQAVALASLVGVEVLNLKRSEDRERVLRGLGHLA